MQRKAQPCGIWEVKREDSTGFQQRAVTALLYLKRESQNKNGILF